MACVREIERRIVFSSKIQRERERERERERVREVMKMLDRQPFRK